MMTPEEQAHFATGELLELMPSVGVHRWSVFEIVLRHIEAALAEAKAEQRREWEEKLRLVQGGKP